MATQACLGRINRSEEFRDARGFALAYLAGMMFVLLALAGLAVDLGRGYPGPQEFSIPKPPRRNSQATKRMSSCTCSSTHSRRDSRVFLASD
jgi:hypothetical protein